MTLRCSPNSFPAYAYWLSEGEANAGDCFDDDSDVYNALARSQVGPYLHAWRALYPEHHPLIATLLFTGLRWGEATALDVDRPRATREEDIDYSEIPELDESFWDNAVFMPNGIDLSKRPARPKKVAISVRLDDDVLSWLKKPGAGY
jgi:uncharacterized protein (DUF4415 family)